MRVELKDRKDTLDFAKKLGGSLSGQKKVLAFYGDLGAGKTTFIRGLANGLGISENVSSPTFSIVNVYKGKNILVHFDMYRILNLESLESTGFFDYIDEDNIIAIEWSENIEEFLPKDRINIRIKVEESEKRTLDIEGLNFEDFGN